MSRRPRLRWSTIPDSRRHICNHHPLVCVPDVSYCINMRGEGDVDEEVAGDIGLSC